MLVKGTQGLSKSTGTLQIVHDLWILGHLRPVFAVPRHDLAQQLIPDEWIHLKPRQPRDKDAKHITPEDGHRYLNAMIHQAAENQTPLALGHS